MMKFIAFLLCLILGGNFVGGWRHVKARLSAVLHSTTSQFNTNVTSQNNHRGFAVCGARRFVGDMIRVLYDFRVHWKTQLPISIYHCNELLDDGIVMNMLREFGNVDVTDLCPRNQQVILGLNRTFAAKRLRGFFCKPAALLAAPYQEVVLLDLDTVFFKNPEALFESKLYKQTGALYFRDRAIYRMMEEHHLTYFLDLMASYNVTLSADYLAEQYQLHGVSFFWHCVRPDRRNASAFLQPCLGEYMDSSVVAFNKASHPKLLSLIERHFPTFKFGYGDKELYWVLGVLSGEDFAFEPFHMHFDPQDADLPDDQVSVLYINAEHMVEFRSNTDTIGTHVGQAMTRPFKIKPHEPLPPPNRSFSKSFRYRNCTCRNHSCMTIPDTVHFHILRAQWMILSLRLQHDHKSNLDQNFCIPMMIKFTRTLARVFNESPDDCPVFGCPHLPVMDTSAYNASNSIWLPSLGANVIPLCLLQI